MLDIFGVRSISWSHELSQRSPFARKTSILAMIFLLIGHGKQSMTQPMDESTMSIRQQQSIPAFPMVCSHQPHILKVLSIELKLVSGDSENFIMRADNTTQVMPTARGRDSVRITSNNSYNDSIVILDLLHMPAGCGTWPAFWTLSEVGPWPIGGEIDIIEGKYRFPFLLYRSMTHLQLGVNMQPQNLASLHTTPGCNMSSVRDQRGYFFTPSHVTMNTHVPLPLVDQLIPRTVILRSIITRAAELSFPNWTHSELPSMTILEGGM